MPVQDRDQWLKTRQSYEDSKLRRGPLEPTSRHRFEILSPLLHFLKFCLRHVPFKELIKSQAKKLVWQEEIYLYDNLPKAFEGFSIVHLSDLHIDERPDMIERIKEMLKDKNPDLIVITGDIFSFSLDKHKEKEQYLKVIESLLEDMQAKHGILAVPGNHDSSHLVEALESDRLKFLCNQKLILERDGEKLQIIGTDDPHYFFSNKILETFKEAHDHFTVALVHTPEVAYEAAEEKVNLYLCGHTHAGQVRLPFNIAPIRRLSRCREFYYRRWHYLKMNGFTSPGVGTSLAPFRMNTTAEITCHILKSN